MKCDVVIIDTGCDLCHPRLAGCNIVNLQLVEKENNNYGITQIAESNDDVGHGTAICNIVCTHYYDVTIIMIKIFDSSLSANEKKLLFVLKYVLNNIECKIINLSLGISVLEQYEEMNTICDKLDKKGIILISAFDNDGSISFPAALNNVVGVTSGNDCVRNSDYYLYESNIVNISAKGNAQKVAWLNGKYSIGKGNSYACAHVSGIALCLVKETNISCRKELLVYMSKNEQSYPRVTDNNSSEYIKETVSQYKRVAVFPFNKEMHALIRFQELLSFEITDVYDIKHSTNIGVSTNVLLNVNTSKTFIIKNINDIDWNTIDAIIIGHVHHLINNQLMSKELLFRLLASAELHDKFVYSFDTLPEEYRHVNKFVYPPMFRDHKLIPFGKLYRQDKPVLAVFGTSSKQGKFSLQLMIRKKLIERGYLVGQLGTEPSSFLFGMNECFHFGYDSEMMISRFDMISLLNKIMYNISKTNIDIILTGCQSETILTGEGNLFNYPLPQIEFLFGILPDAIILVVNPYDDIELIGRTIKFLESCVDCKVVAVVVFPMDINRENMFMPKKRLKKANYINLANSIVSELKIPCFDMDNNEDINHLINLVEETFS